MQNAILTQNNTKILDVSRFNPKSLVKNMKTGRMPDK